MHVKYSSITFQPSNADRQINQHTNQQKTNQPRQKHNFLGEKYNHNQNMQKTKEKKQ